MRLANGSYYQRRLPIQKQSFKYTTWNTWRGDNGDYSDDDDECSSSSLSSIDSISDYEQLDDIASNVKLQHVNSFRRSPQKVSDNIAITTSPSISPSNQLDGDKFNDDQPPTPWGKSTAKTRIIDELSDPTSDIHLYVGQYTAGNFRNVNFNTLLQKYAGNKYKPCRFRENMKLLLTHLDNKTGPFEQNAGGHQKSKVEKWYTSVNNVSKAYSLLFSLLMNDVSSTALARMSVAEIWQSDELFQQYELEKFKEYYKNMVIRTDKRKQSIRDEYKAYQDDMLKLPRCNTMTRGYPFWDMHKASEFLQEDEESGRAKELKPMALWKSRREYQDFPLDVFRKHIYQLRSKRLAAPFWQYKRNMIAKMKYEEVERSMKEWNNKRCNELVEEFDKLSFNSNSCKR
ncbi:hypothetical protein ACHAXH_003899 [Discostella pseudostelligera]|jgi:hypothetical protein